MVTKIGISSFHFRQLEAKIEQLQSENTKSNEKLREHDEAAKKTINQLQSDLQSKLAKVSWTTVNVALLHCQH